MKRLGHRTAACETVKLIGVVAAEDAARAVARCKQAFDGVTLRVERLAVVVDANTVNSGQKRAAERGAEERRSTQLGKTVRLLEEVGVFLGVEQLVIALARGEKRLFRIGVEAQLVGKLVERVGLLLSRNRHPNRTSRRPS